MFLLFTAPLICYFGLNKRRCLKISVYEWKCATFLSQRQKQKYSTLVFGIMTSFRWCYATWGVKLTGGAGYNGPLMCSANLVALNQYFLLDVYKSRHSLNIQ
uniref:Uncharacterized protein n=1 Tax=Opuntia streptacantha TaxID=393608 RepID=A0A7C9AU40_OPUST